MRTVLSRAAPLLTKNAALPSTFRNGRWKNAFSATSARLYARTLLSRPVLMTEEEAANAPEGMLSKDAIGAKGLKFHMAVSPLDCTGCGNCAQVCPAKEKPW